MRKFLLCLFVCFSILSLSACKETSEQEKTNQNQIESSQKQDAINQMQIKKDSLDFKKDWLPIGTVVKVNGIEGVVMIYGRYPVRSYEGKEELYDYVGCPYPIGTLSSETNIFFDKDVITEVVFIGYINEEEKNLRENLIPPIPTT